MSTSPQGDPAQGDHVFNDVATAVMNPFDKLKSLRTTDVDGRDFVATHLLHTYTLASAISNADELRTSRRHSATDDLTETQATLRRLNPRLSNFSPDKLRAVHQVNADTFGAAGTRFDLAILESVQEALQNALSRTDAGSLDTPNRALAGIRYQQLIGSAYDPAAAARVVINRFVGESRSAQDALCPVVAQLLDAIDQPRVSASLLTQFKEFRPTSTGRFIGELCKSLWGVENLKSRGMALTSLVKTEVSKTANSQSIRQAYDSMLSLVHDQVQRRLQHDLLQKSSQPKRN